MPVTMTSGTAGRVRNFGNTFVIATVDSWELSGDTFGILVPTFDADEVDADDRVWPDVLKGLSTGKILLTGKFNSDASDTTDGSSADLTNGIYIQLDLYVDKDAPWGYSNVFGLVTNFKPGVKVENQAALFSCEVMTRGAIGRSSVIA